MHCIVCPLLSQLPHAVSTQFANTGPNLSVAKCCNMRIVSIAVVHMASRESSLMSRGAITSGLSRYLDGQIP